MRTDDLSTPNSWKCWNDTSQAFDVPIGISPYPNQRGDPSQQICDIITPMTWLVSFSFSFVFCFRLYSFVRSKHAKKGKKKKARAK